MAEIAQRAEQEIRPDMSMLPDTLEQLTACNEVIREQAAEIERLREALRIAKYALAKINDRCEGVRKKLNTERYN